MDRYYQTSFSVPPETAVITPLAQDIPLENAILVDIEVVIPRGHSGLTGVRVLQSHQQILPWGNLSWLTGDGYQRIFEHHAEIGAGSISLQGHNADLLTHVFEIRWHLRTLGTETVSPLAVSQQTISDILGMAPLP